MFHLLKKDFLKKQKLFAINQWCLLENGIYVREFGEDQILYASQDGVRSDFNTKHLIKSYLKHPIMTFKIILAIHFEAFKLWAKGIKFIKKRIKIKNNITIEN